MTTGPSGWTGKPKRLSDGERHARFESAYRTLYEPVCGYVVRRIVDPDDAADVVAETFLTLWRRLDDAPNGPDLRPWLFGVARRTAANQRRGQRRRTALAGRLAADLRAVPLSPEGSGDDRDMDDAVERAFASLRRSDRELLSLVAWEGLSHEELAIALGVSRPVVRLRLHRARRRFSEALRQAEVKRTPTLGHVDERRATARPGPRRETDDRPASP